MMKQILISLLFLTAASCVSQKKEAKHNTFEIYDHSLLQSLASVQSSLERQRTEITFTNSTANNCAEYLSLKKRSMVESNTRNLLVKSEYLECDVIGIVRSHYNSRPQPKDNAEHFGQLLATKLDLSTLKTSLGNLLTDDKQTIMTLFPSEAAITPNSVTISSPSRHFKVEVVAVGNINNNSHPDWIAYLSDELLDSNYSNFATLIIYDPSAKQGGFTAEQQ